MHHSYYSWVFKNLDLLSCYYRMKNILDVMEKISFWNTPPIKSIKGKETLLFQRVSINNSCCLMKS